MDSWALIGDNHFMPRNDDSTKSADSSPLREDVVWQGVDPDSYEDISLVPLDPDEERQRPLQRESLLPLESYEEEEPLPPGPQFSIKQMMIAQAVLAVILGMVRVFAPGMLAGVLGLLSCAVAIVLAVYEPEDKRVQRLFVAFFVLYVLLCGYAIWRPL